MATDLVQLQAALSFQATSPTNPQNRSPDSVLAQFTAQLRKENQTYRLAPSGVLLLTALTEGFSSIEFMKLECLTPGKSLSVKLNGAATGTVLAPASASQTVWMVGTVNFSTLEITNLDSALPVDIAVSIYQKQLP